MTFDPSKPFDLPPLPPGGKIRNQDFVDVLLETRTELGELNGLSKTIPNPLLLLSPAVLRESVASSRIENVNTTVENALQMQLFPEAARKPADKEVIRYQDAILWGYNQLGKLPLSTRIILGLHRRLLPDRSSGFRKTQNAITNISTGEVLFTPPEAHRISSLMGNLEAFVNDNTRELDPLVKCSIAHYQFEAIHPFGDGNGRVGRMLMVLSLIQDGLLSLPILYISGYINKNRSDYYRQLRDVSANGEWKEYVSFMLSGFRAQARESKEIVVKLMTLLAKTKERIRKEHRKIYSADLVEALFAEPITTPVSLARRIDVNYRTASRYLTALAKGKQLEEHRAGKYHLFINKPLLALLRR